MKFGYYLLRRLMLQVIVVFGVVTLSFLVMHLMPINPIIEILGTTWYGGTIAKEIMEMWGFDKPLYIQYFMYLNNLVHGNLGRSTVSFNPVLNDILMRLPATMELTVFAFLFNVVIGISIGVISAVRRGSVTDRLSRIISSIGVSAPPFWTGMILLLVFYRYLGLGFLGAGRLSVNLNSPATVTGFYTVDSLLAGNLETFFDAVWHLMLPGFALGFSANSTLMRLTRSSMLEVIDKDYIKTARMKGVSEIRVVLVHTLRNALLPVVTYSGLLLGWMLAGSALIETTFNWPGMGSYMVEAVTRMDFAAVSGACLFMALIYSTINLVVDLLYGVLDPRVRY